jgi:hypothetical protein
LHDLAGPSVHSTGGVNRSLQSSELIGIFAPSQLVQFRLDVDQLSGTQCSGRMRSAAGKLNSHAPVLAPRESPRQDLARSMSLIVAERRMLLSLITAYVVSRRGIRCTIGCNQDQPAVIGQSSRGLKSPPESGASEILDMFDLRHHNQLNPAGVHDVEQSFLSTAASLDVNLGGHRVRER